MDNNNQCITMFEVEILKIYLNNILLLLYHPPHTIYVHLFLRAIKDLQTIVRYSNKVSNHFGCNAFDIYIYIYIYIYKPNRFNQLYV